MPTFLVEIYAPIAGADGLRELADRARRAGGAPVHHLHSIALPSDETVFHLFTGPTAAAVSDAVERAGCAPDRVVEALIHQGKLSPRG
jgi:hypothetical protein